MMESIMYAVFAWGLGYVLGKSFYGLNPFKMILGGVFAGVPALMFLKTFHGHFYDVVFAIGFICVFGNPLGFIAGAYEAVRIELLQHKAMKRASQREYERDNRTNTSFDEDEFRQRYNAESATADEQRRYREQRARDDIRNQAEQLKREREQFEAEMRSSKKGKPDNRTHEQILGVDTGFTLDDLKIAKKRKVAKLHSDKWQDMPPEFISYMDEELKKVLQAFEILSSKF